MINIYVCISIHVRPSMPPLLAAAEIYCNVGTYIVRLMTVVTVTYNVQIDQCMFYLDVIRSQKIKSKFLTYM